MASTSPIVLILGSGSNVGKHVAQAFKAKGYKIAHVSRKVKEKDSISDEFYTSGDLSKPESVVEIFSRVQKPLGIPSVVVYNAGAVTPNDEKDPLSLSLTDFSRDLSINTTSAFIAAQQAVRGFEQLPTSASRTFIYTGNILNTTTFATLLDLGVGKSATSSIIQSAAKAYADRGYKFYYADERKPDGSPAYNDIDGELHGQQYLELAEGNSQGPWQYTFVKGVGYKKF